jgi:hypothetical protein
MTGVRIRDRGSFAALMVAAVLLLAIQSGAQEEDSTSEDQMPMEPALTHPTALESYLEEPGILLVKRHHPLAPVQLQGGATMWLDAVVAFEPGMQHQRGMGIRAEIDAPGLADEERVFHIDVHEIEELVRAIGYMTSPPEGEEPVRGNDRTEMSITTRDGLEVGTLVTAAGTGSFLRTASASFEIRGAGLQTLHATLDKAREHLFSH